MREMGDKFFQSPIFEQFFTVKRQKLDQFVSVKLLECQTMHENVSKTSLKKFLQDQIHFKNRVILGNPRYLLKKTRSSGESVLFAGNLEISKTA